MKTLCLTNSTSIPLVADWRHQNSSNVIVMCHGFMGSRTEHGEFDMLADALFVAGFDVINFDFSGSGQSGDVPLNVDMWIDDLKTMLRWVSTQPFTQIGLFGHSLGGYVALHEHAAASVLVLTAPVTQPVKDPYMWLSDSQRKILHSTGSVTLPINDFKRAEVVVSKELLEMRATVDTRVLLGEVTAPTLLLHGTDDLDVPLRGSRKAIEFLNQDSELVELLHMPHGVKKDFIQPIVSWFATHMT